jgi:uncharacterized protein (TIGR02996 family)
VTDLEALLSAAAADPEDDTRWLVIADALQDQGLEAAAVFVRGFAGPPTPPPPGDTSLAALLGFPVRPGMRPATPKEETEFAWRVERRAISAAAVAGDDALRAVTRYVAAGDYRPHGEAFCRALTTREGMADLFEIMYGLPVAVGRVLVDRETARVARVLSAATGDPVREALDRLRRAQSGAEPECPECHGTGERATYYPDGNLQFVGPCEACRPA